MTATGTSKTSVGVKGFKTITQFTATAGTDASANSIILGDGDVLGLSLRVSVASAVKEFVNGSVVTNGVLVAAGTGTADARGTYAPNSIPNGTNDYDVWYLSDDPEVDG